MTEESQAESRPAPRRRRIVVAAVAAVVLAGSATAVVAATSATPPDWTLYPGSAFRDDADVLAGQSLDEVAANGDSLVAAYRAALTEALGLQWVEVEPRLSQRDINGYGGDSMLQYYNSGTWVGSVALDDPAARAGVEQIFARIATEHGADDVYAGNDSPAGDPVVLYGAALKADQALWMLSADGPDANGLRVDSRVFDSSIPTGPDFDAPTLQGDGTFHVTIDVYSYALLDEPDREAFIEALAAYEGHTPPSR